MEYFLKAYKNYKNFEGRASRAEYWYFVLFYIISFSVLFSMEMLLIKNGFNTNFVFTILFVLFSILPNISLTARRLHDINKSGWLQLINLIPYIGSIILLVLMLIKGTDGDNMYGPDPLVTKDELDSEDEIKEKSDEEKKEESNLETEEK